MMMAEAEDEGGVGETGEIREMKPLPEVTERAIRILCREMGIAETARFLSQLGAGGGNYTEEREHLFKDLTLDDILSEIRRGSPRDDPSEQS